MPDQGGPVRELGVAARDTTTSDTRVVEELFGSASRLRFRNFQGFELLIELAYSFRRRKNFIFFIFSSRRKVKVWEEYWRCRRIMEPREIRFVELEALNEYCIYI